MKHRATYALFLFSSMATAVSAEEGKIYRHVDAQGTVTYSDQPQQRGQQPVSLPKLGTDDQYLKVQEPPLKLQTCESRGGINCEQRLNEGVVCMDGSKSSVQQYAEHCLEAELKQTLLVEFETEPLRKEHSRVYRKLQAVDLRPVVALVVEVRNLSPVPARIQAIDLKLPFLSPRKTPLEGPTEIEPYGLAFYRIDASRFPSGSTPRHLSEAEIDVDCANCKSARPN